MEQAHSQNLKPTQMPDAEIMKFPTPTKKLDTRLADCKDLAESSRENKSAAPTTPKAHPQRTTIGYRRE